MSSKSPIAPGSRQAPAVSGSPPLSTGPATEVTKTSQAPTDQTPTETEVHAVPAAEPQENPAIVVPSSDEVPAEKNKKPPPTLAMPTSPSAVNKPTDTELEAGKEDKPESTPQQESSNNLRPDDKNVGPTWFDALLLAIRSLTSLANMGLVMIDESQKRELSRQIREALKRNEGYLKPGNTKILTQLNTALGELELEPELKAKHEKPDVALDSASQKELQATAKELVETADAMLDGKITPEQAITAINEKNAALEKLKLTISPKPQDPTTYPNPTDPQAEKSEPTPPQTPVPPTPTPKSATPEPETPTPKPKPAAPEPTPRPAPPAPEPSLAPPAAPTPIPTEPEAAVTSTPSVPTLRSISAPKPTPTSTSQAPSPKPSTELNDCLEAQQQALQEHRKNTSDPSTLATSEDETFEKNVQSSPAAESDAQDNQPQFRMQSEKNPHLRNLPPKPAAQPEPEPPTTPKASSSQLRASP